MATKKVKKVLKFPKTVYLSWEDGKDGPDDILTTCQTLEEFTAGFDTGDADGECVAVYELKSVNILEVKSVLTPVK